MIAFMLLLVVIVDTALTGWLLATVKGLKKVTSRNARLIKSICDEEREDGGRADTELDD